ncbi:unnamed protein product [Durusdinium trenchii]|uniref:Disease resistance R13L4/SHOC-2-like LRR domain-containing protein n=2 Tax=Durusdinium trenchii TaxID=1381693 RepID=A0ABP0SAH5_9DINO
MAAWAWRLFVVLRANTESLPDTERRAEEQKVLQEIFPDGHDFCEDDRITCQDGHVTEIRADNEGGEVQLRETLPEAIGEMRYLTRLWFQNNNLSSLPESLGNLHNLQFLDLSNNSLHSLPESLGNFQKLQELFLSYNHFNSLPEFVGNLQSLQRLYVSSNQLSSVPESLGNLQRLRKLGLSNNALSSLPEFLGNLHTLWGLYASHNNIHSWPESFGKLKGLKRLDLRSNALSTLPESFGELQRLLGLDLGNNQLSSSPESFGNLSHLLKLTLSHNPLSSLPALVGNLKNLGELSLINCTLRALPESLGNLQSLLRLDLRANALGSLPDSLGHLQMLLGLDLSNNVLNSLPEYVGSLKNLRHLELQNNHLSSVPFSFGNLSSLEKLDLSNNKLSTLPGSFHKLTNLKHLYLQHNNLTSFFNTSGKNLQLEVLLLNDNQLSNDLLAFCGLKNASTLYLHQNRLGGQIPGMIAELNSIQVLTLHRNSLTGKIPSELATLPSLQLLTLHENRLTGEIPPSFSVRNASALVFLSAFSNDLTGSVPEMTLRGGCVDDQSFRMEAAWKKRDASVTSTISCARKDELDNFDLTSEERQQIQDACPNVYGLCGTAPARGPTLLLQSNRLSCPLPSRVEDPEVESSNFTLRSLVIAGNMLGNHWVDLPEWVSESERQPFLYISSSKILGVPVSDMQRFLLSFLGLLTLYALALRKMKWRECVKDMPNQDDLTQLSHAFLIRSILLMGPAALLLLLCYTWHSSYYQCGHQFAKTTLAYFDGSRYAQFALACLWLVWVLGWLDLIRLVPKPTAEAVDRLVRGGSFSKAMWWCIWMIIVVVLSSPSLGYAFVQSLPKQNSLGLSSTYVSKAIHFGAALLMILIDLLITPKLAMWFSKRSRVPRSMLLMAARTGTMWLNATLCAIYMNEHCMRGWTTFWPMCDPESDLYRNFKVSLGRHPLLDPIRDLCARNDRWWTTDACPRSVVETLAPLFLAKLLQRAFLQPVLVLWLWKRSAQIDGQLHICPLAFLGIKCQIRTSRSLDRAQQATLLVTLAEVAIIWSPLVPLLLPAAAMAAATNLLLFHLGPREFRATVPSLEAGETASMSRKYMQASVSMLLIFQMWFALTSGLCGTSLLALAAVVFLSDTLLGLSWHCSRLCGRGRAGVASRGSGSSTLEEAIEIMER